MAAAAGAASALTRMTTTTLLLQQYHDENNVSVFTSNAAHGGIKWSQNAPMCMYPDILDVSVAFFFSSHTLGSTPRLFNTRQAQAAVWWVPWFQHAPVLAWRCAVLKSCSQFPHRSGLYFPETAGTAMVIQMTMCRRRIPVNSSLSPHLHRQTNWHNCSSRGRPFTDVHAVQNKSRALRHTWALAFYAIVKFHNAYDASKYTLRLMSYMANTKS